jgi:predicted transcriptional regulator
MVNDRACIDLVKFLRILTVLLSDKVRKTGDIAKITGVSLRTVMRLITDIAPYGMIITHMGSKKLGRYQVVSWGIFSKDYFMVQKDEAECSKLFSLKLGAVNLDRMIDLLKATHPGKIKNLEELSNELKVSIETVKRQIRLAKSCGIMVTKTGSKKFGHYHISDFGCFNEQVLTFRCSSIGR